MKNRNWFFFNWEKLKEYIFWVVQPTCDGENDTFCPGPIDVDGCASAGICQSQNPDEKCPSTCPVYCNSDQKVCLGNGCDVPNSCVPMNDTCPHVCPHGNVHKMIILKFAW